MTAIPLTHDPDILLDVPIMIAKYDSQTQVIVSNSLYFQMQFANERC